MLLFNEEANVSPTTVTLPLPLIAPEPNAIAFPDKNKLPLFKIPAAGLDEVFIKEPNTFPKTDSEAVDELTIEKKFYKNECFKLEKGM